MNEWYVRPQGDELHAGPPSNPDRYTLDEVVSEGMEGRLWRSSLPVDGHRFQVAVKEIHQRNVASLDEWFERWERQAELLRSLDHPGLIRVREVFHGDPAHRLGAATGAERSLFLVMNWADGRRFDEWARTHDTGERLAVLAQIAEAIDHLHSGADTSGVAVLHRDIKPQNIIIDDEGRPRLVDFGFARLADGTDYTIVGSANYMAPEIPLGSVPTPASDRYSFGCVAYSVLSGHRVDPADQQQIRRTVDDLRSTCLSAALADHLQRLLDPHSAGRPADLRPWSDAAAGSPSQQGPPGATVVRPAGWWPSGTDPVGSGAPSMSNPVLGPAIAAVPDVSAPPVLPTGLGSGLPPVGPVSWPPARPTSFDPRSPTFDPVSVRSTTLPPGGARSSDHHWTTALGIGLAIAAVIVAIVAAVLWFTRPASRSNSAAPSSTTSSTTTSTTSTSQPVTLADVVGQNRADVVALLGRLGMQTSIEYVESAEPGDKVLAQQPAANTTVAVGTVVRLTVSSPTFTMPDLTGRTLDAAQMVLASAGHLPSYVSVQPSGAPASSTVTGQRPAAGATQAKDKGVQLIVVVPSPPTTEAPPVDTTPTLPSPTAPPTMP